MLFILFIVVYSTYYQGLLEIIVEIEIVFNRISRLVIGGGIRVYVSIVRFKDKLQVYSM